MREEIPYELMSPEEKKIDLFLRQKETLELFLERNAITKAQFDKSYGDLTALMFPDGDAPETDNEPAND